MRCYSSSQLWESLSQSQRFRIPIVCDAWTHWDPRRKYGSKQRLRRVWFNYISGVLFFWSIVFYCGVLRDVFFTLFDVSFMSTGGLAVYFQNILTGNLFDEKTLFNKKVATSTFSTTCPVDRCLDMLMAGMAGLVRSRYRLLLRTRHEPRFSQKKVKWGKNRGRRNGWNWENERLLGIYEFMHLISWNYTALEQNCFHKITGRWIDRVKPRVSPHLTCLLSSLVRSFRLTQASETSEAINAVNFFRLLPTQKEDAIHEMPQKKASQNANNSK